MPMTVSIIVPCYKVGRFIADALESVERQTYDHWELIAVDDAAPDDGTRRIIDEFSRRVSSRKVQYIRHELNQGVSTARNTAIKAAGGELIAFLDPDDTWMPEHLERAVRTLEQREDISVVTGPVQMFWDPDVAPWPPKVVEIEAWKRRYFPASLGARNFIQPSATVVRRSAMERVGEFDTAPDIQHIEDYDMWIRLAQTGSRFIILDEVTCRYRQHYGAATSDAAARRRRYRALYHKHAAFFMSTHGELLAATHHEIASLKQSFRNPTAWLWGRLRRRIAQVLSRRRTDRIL